MIATAKKNFELTVMAKGRHHIADFLPKEELTKFLKKVDVVKTGGSITDAVPDNFDQHKIAEGNIGYQLLQKAGWGEGAGLGKTGTGIAEPLKISGPVGEAAGIGVTATHEVTADDDSFDEYRKRMMLAYRFRPNPLNNPRRAYY